jgi:hypothetical protein
MMFPLSIVPAVIFGIIVGGIGFYMKFSADRDERRSGR